MKLTPEVNFQGNKISSNQTRYLLIKAGIASSYQQETVLVNGLIFQEDKRWWLFKNSALSRNSKLRPFGPNLENLEAAAERF